MTALNDDRLFERLGQALMADPVLPDDDLRAALHRALGDAPAGAATPRPDRRFRVLRRPVAAGVAATILLSGGAAAAVDTDTLPAPIRGIAAALGLPVAPSPLAQAQNAVADLSHALVARDAAATRAALSSLLSALPELSAADRAQLGPAVAELIAEAEIFLAGQPAKSASEARGSDPSSRRNAGGVESADDVGRSNRASSDNPSETGERGPTGDDDASGAPNTGTPSAPLATGGEGPTGGDGTLSGSTSTVGSGDGDGVDGGSATSSVSGGATTTVSTTASDGDGGSSLSGQPNGTDGSGSANTFNSNDATGTDGSGGSDGGTSGSDGGGSGETPH